MRFFKYLFFIFLFLFSSFSFAGVRYSVDQVVWHSTPDAACKYTFGSTASANTSTKTCWRDGALITRYSEDINCPSAQLVEVRVPVNAQTYQCINACQYRLTKCVDIDIQSGMACDAISTGGTCGQAPPPVPKDPTKTPVDSPTGTPAAPGQNTSGTSTNSATSTGTSTSTSTSTSSTTNNTTNNTSTTTTNTTTTTTNNTTTTIDLSSLESTIKSVGAILGAKLDAIKEALGGDSGGDIGTPDGTDLTETNSKLDDIKKNGEKTNNWLQGKNEDGTGGGVGDNPFGTDVTPERVLDEKTFKTNIFQSNAQCPADKTLSLTLFTGRTFTKSISFSMWCDKLAIFGNLILIVSYLYGALIIVRNS